jgi:hypothetical protein
MPESCYLAVPTPLLHLPTHCCHHLPHPPPPPLRPTPPQGGAVAEAGSHDELIAAGGAYAKLVARQLHGGASGVSLGSLLPRGHSSGSLSRGGAGGGGSSSSGGAAS